jgi:hypothetical protein
MAGGNEYNWWPAGPESNQGNGGYADPRNSGASGAQPPWEQPPPPPWGGSGPTDPPRPQRPQRADPRYGEPQRSEPRHGARWDSAPGPQGQGQGQRAGDPERDFDQWDWMADGGPDARARQFPGEAPDRAPYPVPPGGRHRTGPPGDDGQPGTGERGRSGRTLTIVGGGALVAIVLAAFVLGLSRGGTLSGSGPSASSATPGAVTTQDIAGPGTPTVTAHSAGGEQVEFSWTYANSATGDTFRVRENGSAQPTTVDKPDLVLSAPQGQRVCVQVQVISAGNVSSTESSSTCWPS